MNNIILEKAPHLASKLSLIIASIFRYFLTTPFIILNTILIIIPVLMISFGFLESTLTQQAAIEVIKSSIMFLYGLFGGRYESPNITAAHAWLVYTLLPLAFLIMGFVYEKIKNVLGISSFSWRRRFLCIAISYAVLYLAAIVSVFLTRGNQKGEIYFSLAGCYIVAIFSILITQGINSVYKKIIENKTDSDQKI